MQAAAPPAAIEGASATPPGAPSGGRVRRRAASSCLPASFPFGSNPPLDSEDAEAAPGDAERHPSGSRSDYDYVCSDPINAFDLGGTRSSSRMNSAEVVTCAMYRKQCLQANTAPRRADR
jgi:hypothetical protein